MQSNSRAWARQYTTLASTYSFNGIDWPILTPNGGVNIRHMDRILIQTDIMLTHYSKICAVGFDLHMPFYTSNNDELVTFRRRLLKKIRSEYGWDNAKPIGYFWCREFNKGTGQHYHWFLLLDGHKVRSGYPINNMGQTIWENLDGIYHKGQYHNVKRSSLSDQQKLLEHASYLAKIATKDCAMPKIKTFSSSKLELPNNYDSSTNIGLKRADQ